MLFSFPLKTPLKILLMAFAMLLLSCSGSKKYFKAAEKLEKQGLVNEAAEYYLESLQRKPTNVEARIKLKETGQKYVSNLAADFFRAFNTQQTEASLESFERLKDFTARTSALNVNLDYPKGYEEDYQKSVEVYCNKNYNQAYFLVNQKKYSEAVTFINKIKKYNSSYRNLHQLEITAVCEPLYQNAVTCLENKNYSGALNLLTNIKSKTETYKDMQDLLFLASAQQTKSFILFAPKNSTDKTEKDIEETLFDSFNQVASQKFNYAKIINNTPFTHLPEMSGSVNVDLIQAIRKATGADYFYSYDVSNRKEYNSGPQKSFAKGYLRQTTVSGTVTTVEYAPLDYSNTKANRSYSYQYSYKMINAYTNQIVSSQNQNISSTDAVEFNEFSKPFPEKNLNNLFPYNPQQTAPAAQFNPNGWRNLFSANKQLKTYEQLLQESNDKTVKLFESTVISNMK
jgi:hypothetical protein